MGESHGLEFKSSARWDMRESKPNKEMEKIIVKSVAGFLNSEHGGTLLIGVADDGTMLGLDHDYRTFKDRQNRDGYEQFLTNLLFNAYGYDRSPYVRITFHSVQEKQVCRITVRPSPTPVWVKVDNMEQFYVRTQNSSRALTAREAVDYIKHRWR